MKISDTRQLFATTLAANSTLSAAGVTPFVERDPTKPDIDILDPMLHALRTKGLAIVVMASGGGTSSQSPGGAVCLNVLIAVTVVENPAINMATGGTMIPSEDAVELVINALAGLEVNAGYVEVAPTNPFHRQEQEDGSIVNAIIFHAPVRIK